MSATETPVNNGVNVEALLGAREALASAPEAAQFKWRASCEWQNGTHSNSTVEGFFGLGEEQHHRTKYSFDMDHPEIFASEDNGATPVEYVLVGLAGCLTAGVAAVAQNREIQLRKVSAIPRSSTSCSLPPREASSPRCSMRSAFRRMPNSEKRSILWFGIK